MTELRRGLNAVATDAGGGAEELQRGAGVADGATPGQHGVMPLGAGPRVRLLRLLIASGVLLVVGLAACRSADPGDLVGSVPPADQPQASNGPVERATPDGGLPIPTGCVVDPAATPPSDMVSVPAGPFFMGCNKDAIDGRPGDPGCISDEKPAHQVTLDAFSIDKTEVTQAQYALCLQDGKCEKPYCPGWNPCTGPTLPIACVSFDMAAAYCATLGKHLPTEAQWEKASRSDDGRVYPWGSTPVPDCAHANLAGCGTGVLPVGTSPEGASAYGALDMAGNVVEWTTDWYVDDYYQVSPAVNPPGPVAPAQGGSRVGRGGGWRSEGKWDRCSVRDFYESDYVKDSLGFRCIQ